MGSRLGLIIDLESTVLIQTNYKFMECIFTMLFWNAWIARTMLVQGIYPATDPISC